MVIGKTSSSISKAEIFSRFTETQVLSAVFPSITTLPCVISSPLREDKNPSFSIYVKNGHVYYKDFGKRGVSGSLMDLLCAYWGCTFNQALDKLCSILTGKDNIVIRQTQLRTFTRKEDDEQSKIQVVVRPWKDYDYEYWLSYGIEKQWLKHAEIYPISHKIVTKKNSQGKSKRYIFAASQYAYVYVERKDGKIQMKVYQPFNKRYKWCSKMDGSVWGLWTKVPQYGNNLIIGSSVKDCLNISCQLHIPAICMQGEGYLPKPHIIQELKERYKNIIVFFDNDYSSETNTGREDSIKLAEEYNLKRAEIPEEYEAKDPSDLFKKYGKERYAEIMHSILDPVLYREKQII